MLSPTQASRIGVAKSVSRTSGCAGAIAVAATISGKRSSVNFMRLFAKNFSRHAVEFTAARLEWIPALDLVREHDAESGTIRRQRIAVAHREAAVNDVGV